MLDTIIITVLGIIVVIQNIYIIKLNYKMDMLDDLHEYNNKLVRITEMYINKEIDVVNYNYMVNQVKEHIKELVDEYDEDNE